MHRGTVQAGDLFSDMSTRSKATTFGKLQGHVHEGMYKAARFVHDMVADALDEAAARFPGWPLLITGHSLGGGVASLLTMLYKHGEGDEAPPPGLGPIRCFTFGCAANMCMGLANSCEDEVTSVIHGCVVTSVVFADYSSPNSIDRMWCPVHVQRVWRHC